AMFESAHRTWLDSDSGSYTRSLRCESAVNSFACGNASQPFTGMLGQSARCSPVPHDTHANARTTATFEWVLIAAPPTRGAGHGSRPCAATGARPRGPAPGPG